MHVVPPLHTDSSAIRQKVSRDNFISKRVLTSFILEILLVMHVFVKHSSLVKKLFLRCFSPSCCHLTSKMKLNLVVSLMQCRQQHLYCILLWPYLSHCVHRLADVLRDFGRNDWQLASLVCKILWNCRYHSDVVVYSICGTTVNFGGEILIILDTILNF